DFPLEPFPITRPHPVHPELAEHFDAVIGGIELVSGDTELNDPVDQWQRFVDQRKRRMVDDAEVPHPNDEEYARAIEYGYSPTAARTRWRSRSRPSWSTTSTPPAASVAASRRGWAMPCSRPAAHRSRSPRLSPPTSSTSYRWSRPTTARSASTSSLSAPHG